MSDLPQQLINWLYNVLQPQYINKQIVYTHVVQFLQKTFSKGFRIRTRVYTSGVTGNSNLLINVYGSIVLGNKMVIPIEIWIPLNYPFSDETNNEEVNGVPLAFVIPDNANGIYLNPGNFIDSQGKFYHPFLADWYKCRKSIDANDMRNFNLLNMFNLLVGSFEKNNPLYLASPITTALPPKPSKVPIASQIQPNATSLPNSHIQSPQQTGYTMSPQTTGPPLPAKPMKLPTIPLKYQAPLPLPSERQPINSQPMPPVNHPMSPHSEYTTTVENYGTPIVSARGYPPDNRLPLKSPSPPGYYSNPVSVQPTNSNSTPTRGHSRTVSVNDNLIDQDDSQSVILAQANNDKRELLLKLSKEINTCLQEMPENSGLLETINTNTLKIDGLYNQLNHHHNQALANKDNLNSHLDHLSEKLTQISNLNSQLNQFQEMNEKDNRHVHYGANYKVSLDELIIPDLLLTNQLYDITSEIKANKDLIAIISGDFSNEPEIIDNDNFDTCVKSVRNIGRDLFWLELLKAEISKKMSIT